MKVYTKVVLNIADGRPVAVESYEYEGPVALAGGGPRVSYGKPGYSVASQIIRQDQIKKPLTEAISGSIIDNPFQNAASREYQTTVDSLRGSYGARGLANSGIAVQGEQQALSDIQLKAQAQRAGQLTGLLGTASSSPSFPGGTAPQPRGFMGLK